jgi:NADP-dependent 3-hydroxy acid dehydrogenase YdfG
MNEVKNEGCEKEVLAIVTGANGALGKAYLQQLSTLPHVRSVGLARERKEQNPRVEYRHGVDLLEEHQVREAIYSLQCELAQTILLIHPVGKFKFEMQPPQEIDPEVLLSNMGTMVNTIKAVLSRMRSNLIVCAFGSVSDKYNVPFWRSYTEAKNRMRESLQTLSRMLSISNTNVRSVMVNVSTTDTGNEKLLRPKADRKFWLKPEKIVQESLPILLADSGPHYQELDVIETKPGFNPEDYYRNPQKILSAWEKQMGTYAQS